MASPNPEEDAAVVAAGLAARARQSRFGPGVDLLVFARGGSVEGLRAVFEASVKEQDIPTYMLSPERRRQLELDKGHKPKVWGHSDRFRDSGGHTPLHLAAIGNKTGAIELLLGPMGGASIDARNNTGCTPLHLAAQRGSREALELLLRLGADVRAVDDEYHETALHKASYAGESQRPARCRPSIVRRR
jgi:hypothetical protein